MSEGSTYREVSGVAITSLVLGIITLLFFWFPLLHLFPGLLAVVFGILGFREARRGTASGGGLAVAGIICAVLGMIPTFLFVLAAVGIGTVGSGFVLEGIEQDSAAAVTLTTIEAEKQSQAVEALKSLGADAEFKTKKTPSAFAGGLPGGIAGIERDEGGIVRGVDLITTGVKDADIVHLESFPQIQRLHLLGTEITDAGLQHLSRLTKLEELDLSGTAVGNDGVKFLEGLKNLKFLRLDRTQVGDGGLAVIGTLEKLETLFLTGTQISDDGLLKLSPLMELKFLQLQFCKDVTEAGVKELKKSLPDCEIIAGDNNIITY